MKMLVKRKLNKMIEKKLNILWKQNDGQSILNSTENMRHVVL